MKRESSTSGRRVQAAERRKQVVALRKEGKTIPQIAREVGISVGRVHAILVEQMARLNQAALEDTERLRARQVAKLDMLEADVLEQVHAAPKPVPLLTRIRAWLAVVKVVETRSKLLGLMPAKVVQVEKPSPLDGLTDEQLLEEARRLGLPVDRAPLGAADHEASGNGQT